MGGVNFTPLLPSLQPAIKSPSRIGYCQNWQKVYRVKQWTKTRSLSWTKFEDCFFKKTRLFTQNISIVFWTNERFTINLFSYVKNMQLFRHSPPCWHACQHHNLRKRLRISAFTAATRLGLGSSLLMAGSLLSLSIISMFLFDCWVSLSSRGKICCNGRLTHSVLFVVDTIVSKDTHLTKLSFLLTSFVISPFFQRRRGKLTSLTSTISPMETFWR